MSPLSPPASESGGSCPPRSYGGAAHAPVESAPMIRVTLGPLYRFGPLGPRHCRGYRWLVTPLGKIGVVDCQIIGLTGIVLYKKQKHNMAGRPAFSSRTDKITT